MTMPPETVDIVCPECGHQYQDWYRPSVNLNLDNFDDEYLDQCSSAICPECNHKVYFSTLVVRGGVFQFGNNFADAQKQKLEKTGKNMNLSRLQWIKVITPPADWPSYWAYTPNEIEKMRQSNNQVIQHNQLTIFPLAFKGEQSARMEAGDLIALTQHAKITHIVEVLDDNFFEVGGWSNRYVKVIWWKPNSDWGTLPHRKEVLGVDVTPMSGTPYLFDSFKIFNDRWETEGLMRFQLFAAEKLMDI